MQRINKVTYQIFTVIILSLFVSCNTSVIRTPEPKNLISENVMAEVLADIHIAEADIQLANSEDDSIHQTYINYYYAVFENHHITKDAFIQSMGYYIKNPELLQNIYDNVAEILSTKRGVKM
jgi:hypothetical protein